jgi:hypothetical protein
VSVIEAADGLDIDTGVARFRLRPGAGFPFDQIVTASDGGFDASPTGLSITDGDGVRCTTAVNFLAIDEQGPFRSTVDDRPCEAGIERRALASYRSTAFLRWPRDRAAAVDGYESKTGQAQGWILGSGRPGVGLRERPVVDTEAARVGRARDCVLLAGIRRCGGIVRDAVRALSRLQRGHNWKSPNHINRLREIPNTFRGYRLTSGAKHQEGLRASHRCRHVFHHAAILKERYLRT